MTTPKNIADHGWLATDDLTDCAPNIAYWVGQTDTPGGNIFTADAVGTIPVSIRGFATTQTADLLKVQQVASGNVIFEVSTVSGAATGLKVVPAAAASGVSLTVLSTGTDENLTLTPKGAGVVNFANSLAAAGTGATGTILRVGDSGPTTAAQNGWLKVAAAGTAGWVPVWH